MEHSNGGGGDLYCAATVASSAISRWNIFIHDLPPNVCVPNKKRYARKIHCQKVRRGKSESSSHFKDERVVGMQKITPKSSPTMRLSSFAAPPEAGKSHHGRDVRIDPPLLFVLVLLSLFLGGTDLLFHVGLAMKLLPV